MLKLSGEIQDGQNYCLRPSEGEGQQEIKSISDLLLSHVQFKRALKKDVGYVLYLYAVEAKEGSTPQEIQAVLF